MSDTSEILEFKASTPRWRRYATATVAAGAAVAALTAGYKTNHPATASPEQTDDKPQAPAEIYLPLDRKGTQLEFSDRGSKVIVAHQSGNITFIDSQEKATVRFDTLHCEDRELHAGMIVNMPDNLNTVFVTSNLPLPENSLSDVCSENQKLAIAQAGNLAIAGAEYPYKLGDDSNSQ